MLSPELKSALLKTQKKYPGIIFDKYLLRIFIGKIAELKERMSFGEALRYSLNHVGIWDKKTRSAYKSLAGVYFGRRGGRQTAARKKKSRILKKKSPSTVLHHAKTKINKFGQYEFDI